MSSDVRIHVRLGSLRLDYQGTQAFYEAHVEGLVSAAAGTGGRRVDLAAAPAGGPSASNGHAVTSPVGMAVVGGAEAGPAAGATAAFVPRSPEFGRYVKRLGPEAGEPDRQVVALAFYLWNYERRETFGHAELEGCFHALHMPLPPDLPAILVDLTERKRFLEPAGDGLWKLAKKGENYVKTRLLSI